MMEYKNLQEMYQGKYKERMQRQALVVNPNATGEEVEKMIEGGNTQQMFSGQVFLFRIKSVFYLRIDFFLDHAFGTTK
jgi:t-SNARE complex subunit (syntaxin)